jgi:hypothetical protein
LFQTESIFSPTESISSQTESIWTQTESIFDYRVNYRKFSKSWSAYCWEFGLTVVIATPGGGSAVQLQAESSAWQGR